MSTPNMYSNPDLPVLKVIVLGLFICLLMGCASGPQTGVRPDFEHQQVTTVAVAPFYARGAFGMDQETLEKLQRIYEDQAAQSLEQQGFRVIRTEALRDHLKTQQSWKPFDEGIYLRQSLTYYFEPPVDGRSPSIEVTTLRELAQQQAFPAEAILFGEIVYHSQGICRDEPTQFTPYARMTLTSSAPAALPRPCVVSHFQAKLVDTRTGRTMWFNRTFLESHSAQLGPELVNQNIAGVVSAAITEEGGVAPLAPVDKGEVHAGSP